MKRVVIGMRDGKPYVHSVQGKVEVVFRTEPKRDRSVRKLYRTCMYHIKRMLRVSYPQG